MKRIMTMLIASWITSILITGCAVSNGKIDVPAPASSPDYMLTGGLVKWGYDIADSLLSNSKVRIGDNDAVIVASFVNINNLQESSTFGRMIAEHIASRLSQKGCKVIDMRLRTESVFMQEGKGEFLLSRDLRKVSKNHNASAVVVGTYGDALYGIYISARIINPADSTIISSCDYGVALGRDASKLINRNK